MRPRPPPVATSGADSSSSTPRAMARRSSDASTPSALDASPSRRDSASHHHHHHHQPHLQRASSPRNDTASASSLATRRSSRVLLSTLREDFVRLQHEYEKLEADRRLLASVYARDLESLHDAVLVNERVSTEKLGIEAALNDALDLIEQKSIALETSETRAHELTLQVQALRARAESTTAPAASATHRSLSTEPTRGELDQLRRALQTANERHARDEHNRAQMREALDAEREIRVKSTTQLGKLTKDINELTLTLAELEAQCKQKEEAMTSLRRKHNEEMARMTSTSAALRQDLDQLRARQTASLDAAATSSAVLARKEATFKLTIEVLERELASSRQECATLAKQIEQERELLKRAAHLKAAPPPPPPKAESPVKVDVSQLAELARQVEAAQVTIKAQDTDLSRMGQALSDTRELLQKASAQTKIATDQRDAIRSELEGLRASLSDERIVSLNTTNSLRETVQTQMLQISAQKVRIAELEEVNARLDAAISEARSKVDSLAKQVRSLQDQLATQEQAMEERKRAEVQAVQEKISALQRQVDGLVKEKEGLQTDLAARREKVEDSDALRAWLTNLNLQSYLSDFIETGVTLRDLLTLSDADLQQIGVQDTRDRATLSAAIQRFRVAVRRESSARIAV